MRRFWVGVFLLCAAVPSVAQSNCSDIAEATVTEMQAGAGEQWRPEMADLARRAAASACVKTQSGRYLEVGKTGSNAALTVQSAAIEASDATEAAPEVGVADEASAEEAESSGITFKPMSGSPSSKPYMRKRRNKDN